MFSSSQIKQILYDQRSDFLRSESKGEIRRQVDYAIHMRTPEVSIITGVRRCGKSTLLRQIARQLESTYNIHYINFEDQRLARFKVDDFRMFLQEEQLNYKDQTRPQLIVYDEIQSVDEWERWIAELASKQNIKVWLSGSNAGLLASELATLLTGRHRILEIFPLSFSEIVKSKMLPEEILSFGSSATLNRKKLSKQYMEFGGFPRAWIDSDISILSQYYSDILYKDVMARKKVRNVQGLQNVGSLLCSQNTRTTSKNKLTEAAHIKEPSTLAKFCRYFLECYLFSELRLFSKSRRRQLTNRSKFYCIDPLLAKSVGFHHSQDTNVWILENHICNELIRRGYSVFYWHTKESYEVDFIARSPEGELIAIQSCHSIVEEDTKKRELRALEGAYRELGILKMYIVTEDTQDMFPISHSKDVSIRVEPFYDWAIRDFY